NSDRLRSISISQGGRPRGRRGARSRSTAWRICPNRALRIERAALAEYQRVLRIFTDLLIDGNFATIKAAKVACPPDTGLTKNNPARKNRRATSAKSSASC